MKHSWSTLKLGDLFEFKYGKGLIAEYRHVAGSVKVYGSNGIIGRHNHSLSKGPTVVVGRKGSVEEVHFSSSACWPIDTTYYVDEFPDGFPPKYWTFYLKSLRLCTHDKSSAIPGVSRKDIYGIEVPVPPPAEQHRIVAKLEKLLAKVEASQERLNKIPALLKRFRQSVLAAACSGRLTNDWRKKCNQDNHAKTRESDSHIPTTWKLVHFGRLISDGPHNGLYKPQSAYGSGTPIVRIDAFYDGEITEWNELKRLNLTARESRQFSLSAGDILINRLNSPKFLGKAALVRRMPEPSVYESNMMRLRMEISQVIPEYAILYLCSAQGIEELRKNAKHAVNQSSINQEDVKAVLFVLPPLSEQQEIVRSVDSLFKIVDRIEERYKKSKAHIDKLTQSILAKAFRGELVPQDLNDEPASALLERICALKIADSPISKTVHARSTRKKA